MGGGGKRGEAEGEREKKRRLKGKSGEGWELLA